MFPTSLLATLLVSLAILPTANGLVVRKPPVTLGLSRQVNAIGMKNLYKHDLNRAQFLQARGGHAKRAAAPTPQDSAVSHIATVGVGAGTYSLIVDTGSSNTWVGAGQPYQPGPNSQDTGETVQVSYGSGSFSGEEYTDDVTIDSLTISGQSIGVAQSSTGINGVDGILGLGPIGLTQGTTSGGGEIPTVTENLFSQGTIGAQFVAISFQPWTENSQRSGELTWGQTDGSQFAGEITYTPITGSSPADKYWGIDQAITYGSQGAAVLSTTAGIVDTGTTLLLIATDAFQTYQKLTGGTPDAATSLLTISDPSTLESLFFHIGGTTFEFTANAQIWPRALNSAIGGSAGVAYLIVADLGTPSGQGLDFTNGYTWLQRFYAVYDTGNSRVGIATTPHTFDTTN